MRLLDVGCGWGSMVLHAAQRARRRRRSASRCRASSRRLAAQAGRRTPAWPTGSRSGCRTTARWTTGRSTPSAASACSSTSAGTACDEYFTDAARAAAARGPAAEPRHLASVPAGRGIDPRSFIGRYVFPDGELHRGRRRWCRRCSGPASRSATSSRCASTTPARCGAGSPTSKRTGTRRRPRPGPAGRASGGSTSRPRAIGFDENRISIHQVLAVVPTRSGGSGMPPTRAGMDVTEALDELEPVAAGDGTTG